MADTKLTDLDPKDFLSAADELYINDTDDSTDKKVIVDQIRGSTHIFAEDFGVHPDVPDNAPGIQEALDACKVEGMTVVLPSTIGTSRTSPARGELRVEAPIEFPAVAGVHLIGGGGLPVLRMVGFQPGQACVTLVETRQGVRDLKIAGQGDAGTIGLNFVKSSPLSKANVEHLVIASCDVGLRLAKVQDTEIVDVEFSGNATDVHITDDFCSSLTFRGIRCLNANRAIDIDTSVSDIHFIGGTIAPAPDPSVEPNGADVGIRIAGSFLSGSIQGMRLEMKDTGGSGPPGVSNGGHWNVVSLMGQSGAFPVQGLQIKNNYFSGRPNSVDSFIVIADKPGGISIENNFFNILPQEADIKYLVNPNIHDDIGPGNQVTSARGIAPYDELIVDTSANANFKDERARRWRPIKRIEAGIVVNVTATDVSNGYVDKTVLWSKPFSTLTLSAQAYIDSVDAGVLIGEPFPLSYSKDQVEFRIPLISGSGTDNVKFDVDGFGY